MFMIHLLKLASKEGHKLFSWKLRARWNHPEGCVFKMRMTMRRGPFKWRVGGVWAKGWREL